MLREKKVVVTRGRQKVTLVGRIRSPRRDEARVIHWQRQKSAHLINSARSRGRTCSYYEEWRSNHFRNVARHRLTIARYV